MSRRYNSINSSRVFAVTVLARDGTLDHFAHFLHDLVWPLYHWLYMHGKLYETGITIIIRDKRAHRYFFFLKELFNCCFLFGNEWKGAVPIVLMGMESSNRRYCDFNLCHIIDDPRGYLNDFQSFVFSRLSVNLFMDKRRILLVERKERSEPGDKKEGPVAGRGADRRAITNHEEVRDALFSLAKEKRMGFQNAVLGEMTFREQVEAFASSSVVVGQHGAGLHHVLWMPEDSLLQEVHKSDEEAYRLRRICKFFGHTKHQNMVCPVNSTSSFQGSIKVNVETLVERLKEGMEP